jgi:hypothetical protein
MRRWPRNIVATSNNAGCTLPNMWSIAVKWK